MHILKMRWKMNKNILSVLLLNFLILSLISCNSTPKQFDVNISCVVKNFTQNQEKYPAITIIIKDFITDGDATYREKIKSDGSFHIQFPHYNPQDLRFNYGKRSISLFLQPGSNLNINFDADEFVNTNYGDTLKSIHLSGDEVEINQAIVSFGPEWNRLRMSIGQDHQRKLKELSPNEYKEYLGDFMAQELLFLDKFVKTNKSTKEFKAWAEYQIKYSGAVLLLRFPLENSRMNNKMISECELPDDYYDFLREIEIDCKKATISSDYFQFLYDYNNYLLMNLPLGKVVDFYATAGKNISEKDKEFLLSSKAKSHLTFTKEDIALLSKIRKENMELEEQVKLFDLERRLDHYLNVLEKGFVRDILLTLFFYSNASSNESYSFLKQHLETYNSTVTDVLYKSRVLEKFNETEIMLNDPLSNNLYSSAKLQALDGDTLVSKILEKYEGKVIYIDFWAPWCGACMWHLPYLNDVKQNFTDKEVAFVNLCCRTGELTWKAAIKKHNLKGENYLLDDNQYFQFKELFKVNGLPHFVLIDKNGNIIDNNTMRPKDHDAVNEALVARINELL